MTNQVKSLIPVEPDDVDRLVSHRVADHSWLELCCWTDARLLFPVVVGIKLRIEEELESAVGAGVLGDWHWL